MKLESIHSQFLSTTFRAFAFVILLFGLTQAAVFYRISQEESLKQKKEINATILSLQTNIAEKIAILSSSYTFLDFIRSGEQTRNSKKLDMRILINNFSDSSMTGVFILDKLEKPIFSYGDKSPFGIQISLCYLNDFLDNTFGNCRNSLKIYFNKEKLIKRLIEINPNIYLCKNCKSSFHVSQSSIGTFSSSYFGDPNLSIGLRSENKINILIIIETMMILILILIFTLINKKFKKISELNIYTPLKRIAESLHNDKDMNLDVISIFEIRFLAKAINQFILNKKEEEILKRNASLGELAKKVAHDIRSPLTSLEYLLKAKKDKFEENERVIVNQSVERINDIISTLRTQKIDQDQTEAKIEIIDPLVKRIISEKRLEFNQKPNIEIKFTNLISYGKFVQISKTDFHRTLSNLLNNAAEAAKINQKLIIEVILTSNQGHCIIQIKDNGKGIPKELVSKVFEMGVSFEKNSGSGIGLTTAKETIEIHQGNLTLESELNVGTQVTIQLPIVPVPQWFKNVLTISKKKVCIVDDDDSIHSIWDEILSPHELSITHFKSSTEFEHWIKEVDKYEYNFLFDLELLGSQNTGLDLIKKYRIESVSTLVTSHYDDAQVLIQAQSLNIKIIPKDSAAIIPIEIRLENNKLIILIDDDKLIHMGWRLAAKAHKINLFTYYSIEDFIKDSEKYPKDTPIYIDSNLRDGKKGEVESKKIYDDGFKNITLASGTIYSQLPYWIKASQGKSFPLG